jgi:predicted transposase/invertase (TIGR01784 family)
MSKTRKTNPVHQKHDKMFKAAFQITENVADFIHYFLPIEIASQINLDSLVLDNTTYVTRQFEGHYSDIVYKATWKEPNNNIVIAILFEHKVVPYQFIYT